MSVNGVDVVICTDLSEQREVAEVAEKLRALRRVIEPDEQDSRDEYDKDQLHICGDYVHVTLDTPTLK